MQNPFTTRDHKTSQNKHDKKCVSLGGGKPTKFNGECLSRGVGGLEGVRRPVLPSVIYGFLSIPL